MVMHRRRFTRARLLIAHGASMLLAASSIIRTTHASCLVGDIMYSEGDSIGQIGLECINATSYDGLESFGPDGNIIDEERVLTCGPEEWGVPYCVQCGPRMRGNALCLSTPTTDRDCGESDYFENNTIVCPDGQEPIPDTFCGRGPDRVDCGDDEFCFIEPADRFAVCCPYPEHCCDPETYDHSWDWGNYCCSDGNWYAVDMTGGGNCQDKQLEASQACPSVEGNPGDSSEVKCCDPDTGPGGCPDENGSFDRCWDEGGYCCSDGNWYADDGAGGNNCQNNQLEDSQPCDGAVDDYDTSGGNMNIGGAAAYFFFASCGHYLAVFAYM